MRTSLMRYESGWNRTVREKYSQTSHSMSDSNFSRNQSGETRRDSHGRNFLAREAKEPFGAN